jgi:aspartyl/asparaginyl-tRNA synthetase
MALGKVYTFGPTFRAENSNTSRHLAEFWMIEPEVAFNDLEDNMNLAEDFLKYLVQYALSHCADDLAFLTKQYDAELLDRLQFVLNNPFQRLTYTEAVEILRSSGHKFEFPVEWGTDLQSEHERYLVEQHFKRPVILTNYPKDIKAFYMRANDDGKTVAAMDVLVRSDHMWRAWLSVACCLACCHLHVVCCRLSRMHAVICMLSRIHAVYCMSSTAEVGFQVPGVGELIGGSQREERLDVLEAKLDSLGMDKVPSVPSRATAVNPPTVPLNPFGPAGGEARVTHD